MYVGDKINTKSRDTLLRIRKAHMKLNKGDIVQFLRTIPKFSVLSFTQKILEKADKSDPSKSLLPRFDFETMKYKYLGKCEEFIEKVTTGQEKQYVIGREPELSIECTINKIVGVPNVIDEKAP